MVDFEASFAEGNCADMASVRVSEGICWRGVKGPLINSFCGT